MKNQTNIEPNMEIACQWWTDLPDIWTPIGWKDHYFRFNVLWNGTILSQPDHVFDKRTHKWKGQGVQVSFAPGENVTVSQESDEGHKSLKGTLKPVYLSQDDGMVTQGWNESPAPVLWSEWTSPDGLLIRQEVFAHIPGAKDVVTAMEPLFAWVRMSVYYICDVLLHDTKDWGFLVRINTPHFLPRMTFKGYTFDIDNSMYPRRLQAEPNKCSYKNGFRLIEEGGNIRLGIAAGQECHAEFLPQERRGEKDGIYDIKHVSYDAYLNIDRIPAKTEAHVDILIPMLPVKRNVFDKELALGYDRALEQANKYWTKTSPKNIAYVETPEKHINETIKHSLKFAQVLTKKCPDDGSHPGIAGSYAAIAASLWYVGIPSVPFSMFSVMLLDNMGYHGMAEKYLEVFKKTQGTVVPPGKHFAQHPGYLATPKGLTSNDWLCDHGALLYAISEHALLTGNQKFIGDWLGVIVKACEFIKDARAIKGHGGVEDLIPAGRYSDREQNCQHVWNDGWSYKGLTTAVKLLRRLKHPRAEEFAVEAKEYKKVFGAAFRAKSKNMPEWTFSKGEKFPWVPMAVYGEMIEETRHPYYLDCGPLFLVYSGLMDAGDKLMKSYLLWFREGPVAEKLSRYASNFATQPGNLQHEMSSAEPCYSWNIFHSHQLGDRQKFLEGMYSLFAGAVSRKTYIGCETRGGIAGTIFPNPLAVYLARLAVVDDQIVDNELHLLRLMPLAWLKEGAESVFEKMPTIYGPITLKTKLESYGKILDVSFQSSFRTKPDKIVLHCPPIEELTIVRINGGNFDVAGKHEIILDELL